MIRSAKVMASWIAETDAGEGRVVSCCASLRAARILAAINSTRLRPSSTMGSVAYSPFVRHSSNRTRKSHL